MVETSSFNPSEAAKPRRKKVSAFKSDAEFGAALAAAEKATKVERARKTGEALAKAGESIKKEQAEKSAKEELVKSNKRKSKEMETDFDERLAGYAEENKKVAQEASQKKHKEVMTELRGKLKNRAAEKNKLATEEATKQSLEKTRKSLQEDEFESFEVSGGEDKDAEDEPEITITEDEPIGEIKTSESKEAAVTSGEISSSRVARQAAKMERLDNESLQPARESESETAQTAYVKAYREYDPRFTTNKPDDQIAKTKPPFFAFGKAVRELRRLHGVMVRAEDSKIGGLSPEARQAIVESGQWDEDVEAEKMKHAPENK